LVKNRRTFLIASGAAGFAAMLARSDRTAALAETAKVPSEMARGVAATMRRFDANLSASDLATIARGIDDANVASAALRTKRRPLRNGEEPVTSFVVPFD
jgi:hypothetical protein